MGRPVGFPLRVERVVDLHRVAPLAGEGAGDLAGRGHGRIVCDEAWQRRLDGRLAGAAPAVNRAPSLFDAPESEPATPFLARSAAQGPEVARPHEVPRQGDELRWVPIESLESLPLSSPGRRVARFIAGAVGK